MQLYGIGDLHLSLGVPEKPMDIFHGWENYMQLLEQHWRAMVQPEDTVVLAGDLSWGMTLPQAKADFAFLETLPGQKIILKGNHDYWWNSMKKMQQFLRTTALIACTSCTTITMHFSNMESAEQEAGSASTAKPLTQKYWLGKCSGWKFPFSLH